MDNVLFNILLDNPQYIPNLRMLIDDKKDRAVFNVIYETWQIHGKTASIEYIQNRYPQYMQNTKIHTTEGDMLHYIDERNKIQKTLVIGELSNSETENLELADIITSWEKNIIEIEPPNIVTTSKKEDVIAELKKIKTKQVERIDTGFKQFNDLLNKNGSSGWVKKYCYLFNGLTGTGKSFILSNIAARALRAKYNVVFVSIEMDQWQVRDIIYRSYFNTTRVEDIALTIKPQDMFKNLAVLNYSNMSHSMLDIQRDIKHLPFKADIIIVDYLDNLAPSRVAKQSWEVHQVISNDMSRCAQELDVPLITASQTNRTAANKDGKGGTVEKYGYDAVGSSFNKSHVFAGIWNIMTSDNDYNDTTNVRHFKLSCMKNREGKQMSTDFFLNYSNARLYEPGENNQPKNVTDTIKKIQAGVKTTKSADESTVQVENFDTYYERLKDDPNYKQEINDIDTSKLDSNVKSKLTRKITTWQKSQEISIEINRKGKI